MAVTLLWRWNIFGLWKYLFTGPLHGTFKNHGRIFNPNLHGYIEMGNANYRKYFVLQMDLFIVWTIYSMDKIYDIMDYKWSW